MEKIIKPVSGYIALLISLVVLAGSIYCFIHIKEGGWMIAGAIVLLIASFFIMAGLMVIYPNHSRVLNFFGNYVGTVKTDGLFFVNPLYTKQKISLRSENLQGQTMKVNDKMGNPIEIGAGVV